VDLPSINAARNYVGANRAVAVCKAVLGDWLLWVKVEELSVLMGNAIFSERGEREIRVSRTEFQSKKDCGRGERFEASLERALKKREACKIF